MRAARRHLIGYRARLAVGTFWLLLGGAGIAHAQNDTVLVDPAIPPDYDRGRNVGVTERPRPDYDALGIRSGGFLIYPRLDLTMGVSDNVYATASNRFFDGFGIVAPSVRVTSDWSRNQLLASAGGRFRRDLSTTPVDSDEWNLNALGRLDIGAASSLTVEGQAAQVQEEPFSGSTDAAVAALSRYRRAYLSGRGVYRIGRTRLIGAIDTSTYTFDPVTLTSGENFSQADRDRQITRATGQGEYALSPSTILYGQVTYSTIDYDRALLNGQPNRDSTGWRALAGINLDISGFLRGTIGVGYGSRNYQSNVYKNIGGLSVEGQLEYFYSDMTNVTLTFGRTIEDATLASTGAFFNSRVGLRLDHEFRANILGYVGANYLSQDYIGSDEANHIYRARAGGSYLISRSARILLDTSYSRRDQKGVLLPTTIDEFRAGLTLSLQR